MGVAVLVRLSMHCSVEGQTLGPFVGYILDELRINTGHLVQVTAPCMKFTADIDSSLSIGVDKVLRVA